MARTACFVCLVSTVSGHLKNALGRGSASSWHITRLEKSTFLRYLCLARTSVDCFANSKVLRSLPAVYWHAMSICTLLFLLKTFLFRVLHVLARNHLAERYFANTICSKQTCWPLMTVIICVSVNLARLDECELNECPQAKYGQMSAGQMSAGQMSACQKSACQRSAGIMSASQMSACQMSTGQMFISQMSVCQMSVCQMPVGPLFISKISINQRLNICWPSVLQPNVCRSNVFWRKAPERTF
jgi:hypothetical protein